MRVQKFGGRLLTHIQPTDPMSRAQALGIARAKVGMSKAVRFLGSARILGRTLNRVVNSVSTLWRRMSDVDARQRVVNPVSTLWRKLSHINTRQAGPQGSSLFHCNVGRSSSDRRRGSSDTVAGEESYADHESSDSSVSSCPGRKRASNISS